MAVFQEHVCCMRCGKQVSGLDPEMGIVVRAWVCCPECIEARESEMRALLKKYMGHVLNAEGSMFIGHRGWSPFTEAEWDLLREIADEIDADEQ